MINAAHEARRLESMMDSGGPGYRYQVYGINSKTGEPIPRRKMIQKLDAFGGLVPRVMAGLNVVDIGCNNGFFTFLSAYRGAVAHGIDSTASRIRFCERVKRLMPEAVRESAIFRHADALEWLGTNEIGSTNIVFLCSVYHHLLKATGDHWDVLKPVKDVLAPLGYVIYEGPTDERDEIVRRLGVRFREQEFLEAAGDLFHVEHIGPAIHQPTRQVYKFTRVA